MTTSNEKLVRAIKADMKRNGWVEKAYYIELTNPLLYEVLNELEFIRLLTLVKKYGWKPENRVRFIGSLDSWQVTYYNIEFNWNIKSQAINFKENFLNSTSSFDWKCARNWRHQFNQLGKLVLNRIHWDKHSKVFYPEWGIFDKDLNYYNLYDYV